MIGPLPLFPSLHLLCTDLKLNPGCTHREPAPVNRCCRWFFFVLSSFFVFIAPHPPLPTECGVPPNALPPNALPHNNGALSAASHHHPHSSYRRTACLVYRNTPLPDACSPAPSPTFTPRTPACLVCISLSMPCLAFCLFSQDRPLMQHPAQWPALPATGRLVAHPPDMHLDSRARTSPYQAPSCLQLHCESP